LQIAQHRLREKEFFRAQGLDTAAFLAIDNASAEGWTATDRAR